MNNLIIQSKQGNKKAIGEILKSFEPLIYKTSISYYIYGYDMEDIRQITIITIINAVEKFDTSFSNSFPAYVQKCIRNQMNTEIEKATKIYYKDKENKEIAFSMDLKEIIDENTDVAEEYINKEISHILFEEIGKLDLNEKALLNSIYVKGITLKEYAEKENIEYHKARYAKDKILEKLKSAIR